MGAAVDPGSSVLLEEDGRPLGWTHDSCPGGWWQQEPVGEGGVGDGPAAHAFEQDCCAASQPRWAVFSQLSKP